MDWSVKGHEWAVRLLQGHIHRDEVRHAYLFTGPAGVGRRTLALRFAQALNCTQPPAPGLFCGTCRICRQIQTMQHGDLTVLQAEKEGGVLKVEQVREMQRTLALLPYEARFRVALLLEFQDANPNAQNALLKTLEEAPQSVILLLTADYAESLLPTIVSRCEVLRLRPMPVDRLNDELISRGVTKDSSLVAHLAGGRLGYALKINDHPDLMDQREVFLADIRELLGANRKERFSYAESYAKDREVLRQRFGIWLSFWRDVMLCVASPHLPLVNLDYEANICNLAQRLSMNFARQRVTDIEKAIARLDANLNARLLTEVLLLDWPRINLIESPK